VNNKNQAKHFGLGTGHSRGLCSQWRHNAKYIGTISLFFIKRHTSTVPAVDGSHLVRGHVVTCFSYTM